MANIDDSENVEHSNRAKDDDANTVNMTIPRSHKSIRETDAEDII